MIDVSNGVKIVELDGAEPKGPSMPTIGVHSHWNSERLVVMEIAGRRYTVAARDLEEAVKNATNTNRYG